MFCSQVVAEAYLLYGMRLLPGKVPSQIYPGLLLESRELSDVTDKCIRRLGSVSSADTYNLVVETASQELPGNEMRMNRRVFDAIRKELGDSIPERIHSLPDLTSWLAVDFRSEGAMHSDPAILNVLEREGMFKWHDEFRANSAFWIALLEMAADQAEAEASAGIPLKPEIQEFLQNLADTAQLRQTSLQGRRATSQEYQRLARKTGLKLFDHLSAIYREQYENAERLHRATDRMIAGLKLRPSA